MKSLSGGFHAAADVAIATAVCAVAVAILLSDLCRGRSRKGAR